LAPAARGVRHCLESRFDDAVCDEGLAVTPDSYVLHAQRADNLLQLYGPRAAQSDIDRALRLVTLKLVGYTEVVHALRSRIGPDGAIVLFGGLAKERPYPGSTTVSTVNGGVAGLLNTLVVELAPIRVNAIHPGIVGDSPYWRDRDLSHVIARTPCGQLARMTDIVDAVAFLLGNRAVNGVSLNVDGGWLLG